MYGIYNALVRHYNSWACMGVAWLYGRIRACKRGVGGLVCTRS